MQKRKLVPVDLESRESRFSIRGLRLQHCDTKELSDYLWLGVNRLCIHVAKAWRNLIRVTIFSATFDVKTERLIEKPSRIFSIIRKFLLVSSIQVVGQQSSDLLREQKRHSET